MKRRKDKRNSLSAGEVNKIFSNSQLRLPLEIPLTKGYDLNSISIVSLLENVYKHYRQQINYLNDAKKIDDEVVFSIMKHSDSIIDAIKTYYDGRLGRSIENFRNAFFGPPQFKIQDILPRIEYPPESYFYRIRKSSTQLSDRKELFHIPFQNRGKAGSQRFSSLGFPSLYLSTSTYICWEEFNQPNYDQLYLSRFTNKEAITLYNLSFTQYYNISEDLHSKEDLIRLLQSYPLIAACSVLVKNSERDDLFKPQYIIPQIVFETLFDDIRDPVSGIVYSSSKIRSVNFRGDSSNIILPTKRPHKGFGYCKGLTDVFKMTQPIFGNLYLVNDSSINDCLHNVEEIDIHGLSVPYENTIFAKYEKILSSLCHRDIEEDFKGD